MINSIIVHNILAGPGLTDISPASNLWHIRNYETVSKKVYVLAMGSRLNGKKIIRKGNTIVISLGSGSTSKDIFLSIFFLFKFVRRIKPELTISYEQVFLWWTLLLTKIFTKTISLAIPIALPEQIYLVTGKSLSRILPIWLERISRDWSFRMVNKIVTTKNLGDYRRWLLSDHIAKRKTIVLNSLPEEAPSFNYILNRREKRVVPDDSDCYHLFVTARLEKEKLIDHAILALAELAKRSSKYRLTIVGGGSMHDELIKMAKEKGLSEYISFEGYKNTLEIIEYYKRMHVFLSPYTGGAFREAALMSIPIVAYNHDWIKGALVPDVEYAAVEFLNYVHMADQIERVIKDNEFADLLVRNMSVKAEELWMLKNVSKEFDAFL